MPKNSMCSQKCANPRNSVGSAIDPMFTFNEHAALSVVASCTSTTRIPFGSSIVWDGGGRGEEELVSEHFQLLISRLTTSAWFVRGVTIRPQRLHSESRVGQYNSSTLNGSSKQQPPSSF